MWIFSYVYGFYFLTLKCENIILISKCQLLFVFFLLHPPELFDLAVLSTSSKIVPSISEAIDVSPQRLPKSTILQDPVEADTPRKVKLRQQIRHMSVRNFRQSQQIRKLQKRVWDQKKHIFKMQSVIAELKNLE